MSHSTDTGTILTHPWRLLLVWLALVSLGFAGLGAYGVTAGYRGAVPGAWPADVARPAEPTVLCFIHPKCPCSRATLTELRRLALELPDSTFAELIVFQPEEAEGFWGNAVWRELCTSSQISAWGEGRVAPRMNVRLDRGGAIAKKFGAATSGMILAYGRDGELRFQGGITASRGHEGPSVSQRWLTEALGSEERAPSSAPVFGCPIFEVEDPHSRQRGTCCDSQAETGSFTSDRAKELDQ
jgi:hypothetical protein